MLEVPSFMLRLYFCCRNIDLISICIYLQMYKYIRIQILLVMAMLSWSFNYWHKHMVNDYVWLFIMEYIPLYTVSLHFLLFIETNRMQIESQAQPFVRIYIQNIIWIRVTVFTNVTTCILLQFYNVYINRYMLLFHKIVAWGKLFRFDIRCIYFLCLWNEVYILLVTFCSWLVKSGMYPCKDFDLSMDKNIFKSSRAKKTPFLHCS